MASKDVVTEEVLQKLISKLEEIVNNYCHNMEEFTEDEVNSFFDGTSEEITYYQSLIIDNHKSKNFLWSSAKVAEEIANAIIESNAYTDEMFSDIASISLEYVDTLPATGESNIIYILKSTETDKSDTLNLYNATSGWTTIGDFKISMDNYYNKTEADTLLDKKANKDEVVSVDKISQTLSADTNTTDTILSTKGLQAELDKKVDKTAIKTSISTTPSDDNLLSEKYIDENIVKKTDITTTIDSSSTNDTIPTTKIVWDSLCKICDTQVLVDANKPTSKICMSDLTTLNTPSKEGKTNAQSSLIISIEGRDYWNGQISIHMASPEVFVRSVRDANTWTKWRKLCTTSVADVPLTKIIFTDSTKYDNRYNSSLNNYIVKNGICYVSLDINVISNQSDWVTVYTSLPRPIIGKIDVFHSFVDDVGDSYLACGVWEDGTLKIKSGENNIRYLCNFSYPVSES